MNELQLSAIHIYPVKSLGGISLQSADVLPKGLRYDRRWMLVTDDNRFMTQREFPQLTKLKMELEGNFFKIRKGQEMILLDPDRSHENIPVETRVWDDEVLTYVFSREHSRWISEQTGVNCRLVIFPEENKREIDPLYGSSQEHVSLADGYPFLIIGEKSLEELNARLEIPLPMNRFRPNFVFSGGTPFEEDGWKEFSIGENRFRAVKPCGRCVMTTVDQETGEKGKEPLQTLAKFRQKEGSVLFGQNLLALDFRSVRVGDPIVVISKQTPALQ